MLSESLKQLIEASLVDGILSPEERAVLLKRAIREGIDADEANILIDAEVQKVTLQKQQEVPTANDANNRKMDFLIEQMNRGLSQLKSGTTDAQREIASLEELRRRAMKLYGDNPKMKMFIEEVKQEIDAYKRAEEEKKAGEVQQNTAAKNSGGGSGLLGKKSCLKGCLIGFILFNIVGGIGLVLVAQKDKKTDQQYEQLMGKLDTIKEEPITIENFEQKVYGVKDLVWITEDPYSDHEKTRRKAFGQMTGNYIKQLMDFYSVNAAAITEHYGHPISLDFSLREISASDLEEDTYDDWE